jgi:hypothetical protein
MHLIAFGAVFASVCSPMFAVYEETGAICPAVALHGHMYACQ